MNAFERLSGEAKRVLACARDEAERARAGYIGTEHLLIGLLRVEGGIAARALAELGVDLEGVRASVEAAARRPAPPGVPLEQTPTTRTRRVLELAFDEAARGGATTVTTGSVLAGLVLEEDGLASHLLRDRGVTVAAAREVVTRLAELGVTEGRDGGGPAG